MLWRFDVFAQGVTNDGRVVDPFFDFFDTAKQAFAKAKEIIDGKNDFWNVSVSVTPPKDYDGEEKSEIVMYWIYDTFEQKWRDDTFARTK